MTERLLSPTKIAADLGVGFDRVKSWIVSGQLPAINLGTTVRPRFRVKVSDVDAFLTKRRRVPAPNIRRVKARVTETRWV